MFLIFIVWHALVVAHGFLAHWLWVHAGIQSNSYTNWWGDIGSDIGEITLIGAVVAMYRKHNCHVKGCWRLSKYQVKGTTHVVCRKHHPKGDLSAQDVLDDYANAKADGTVGS